MLWRPHGMIQMPLSREGEKEATVLRDFEGRVFKGGVTALVFGKRPDLYRVYHKVAEKRERGADILYAGMFYGAPTPIVTRVERQCSGKAFPQQLSTLGGIFEHGVEADRNRLVTLVVQSHPASTDIRT